MQLDFLRSDLIKTAGIYGILNVVKQLIPFLLLPVLTYYLLPADFGILAMFATLISFFYAIVGLNLDGAVGREYFDRDKFDFPGYTWNCVLIGSVLLAASVPAVYLLMPTLTNLTGVPADLVWLALLIAYGRYLIQLLLVIWQSSLRAFSYAIFQFLQIICEMGLAIILIVMMGQGLEGRIHSQIVTVAVFAVISLVFLVRGGWFVYRIDQAHIRKAIAFGLPLVPHAVGALIISMTDRFLLMNMVGAADTGIYFVAFQIGNVLGLAVLAFNQAWSPWLFSKLKLEDVGMDRQIIKVTYLYFVAVTLAGVILSAMAPFIYGLVIDGKFSSGMGVVPWIAAGAVMQGMYYMVGCYITYARKTHILSWITLGCGIVNFIAVYILIGMNGAVGAAQGTFISLFLTFILTWILAARVHPMPWFARAK